MSMKALDSLMATTGTCRCTHGIVSWPTARPSSARELTRACPARRSSRPTACREASRLYVPVTTKQAMTLDWEGHRCCVYAQGLASRSCLCIMVNMTAGPAVQMRQEVAGGAPDGGAVFLRLPLQHVCGLL